MWWSLLKYGSTVSLGLCLVLAFLLGPCFYSYTIGRHHTYLHISLLLSSLLTTSSFLWPTLPFSIFLHVLQLGYCNGGILFLFSSPLLEHIYILFSWLFLFQLFIPYPLGSLFLLSLILLLLLLLSCPLLMSLSQIATYWFVIAWFDNQSIQKSQVK